MKGTYLIAGLLTAAGITTGCAAVAAPPHHTVTTPPAVPAASPAAVTTPALSARQNQLVAWKNGPGYTDFRRVEGDFTALQGDASAGSLILVEAAGSKLAADATAASALPPPYGTRHYILAMSDYVTAGTMLAGGDISGGGPELGKGSYQIDQVTAAMRSALP